MRVNKATRAGDLYEIHFDYTVKMIGILRCLPGWQWSKEKKCGLAKASPAASNLLRRLSFEIEGDELDFDFGETEAQPSEIQASPAEDVAIQSPFIDNLRKYQQEAVQGILRMNDRALLADEMGLGKTPTALTWLEHVDGSPALVITTASTKLNWKEEATKWTTRITHVIFGAKPTPLPPADLYIINYHVVPGWVDVLKSMKFSAIVLDECHNVKNHAAKRTKAVVKVVRSSPRFLPMSGTPVMSAPMEMFTVLQMLDKKRFPSRVAFGMEYCDPQIDPWSGTIEYKGASNVDKLKKELSTIMIRRLKSDVLTELPSKQRTRVEVEIDNRAEYQRLIRTPPKDLSALGIKNRLQAMLSMSATGKIAAACEWIDGCLAQGEKLLLGVHHVAIAKELQKRYGKKALSITGETPVARRQALCKQFDDDPNVVLMIGEHEAAGEGLNLQKSCSNVAFFEYPWTPSRLVQFEDRVHRFGQSKGVSVWYLVARDTIEDKLLDVLLTKSEIVSSVLDGGQATASTVKELWRFLVSTN